jgi:hypothetical protein
MHERLLNNLLANECPSVEGTENRKLFKIETHCAGMMHIVARLLPVSGIKYEIIEFRLVAEGMKPVDLDEWHHRLLFNCDNDPLTCYFVDPLGHRDA